ncbi:hypothetical protein HK102_005838 [Quaeritorhiza haematococci]|nr:hypothetical protein HK102_005838 [Quaeritorhiza haematococci]
MDPISNQTTASLFPPDKVKEHLGLMVPHIIYVAAFLLALVLTPLRAILPPYKTGPLRSYRQPGDAVLNAFARVVLYFFPVSLQWNVDGTDKENRVDVAKFLDNGSSRLQLPNDGKVLFVVNHNLYAADMLVLMLAIYVKTGVFPRGLADTAHSFVPIWAHLLFWLGAFPGTRENCTECMKAGQTLLVFPGGHHEVLRRKSDPKYHVIWKERMGFAKLAVAHGYTIIPLSSVGTGDMLRHIIEVPIPDVFPKLIGDKRRGLVLPIAVPMSLERQYIKLSASIPTDSSKADDNEYIKDIREKSRLAVNSGIDEMVAWQKDDPDRYILKPLF